MANNLETRQAQCYIFWWKIILAPWSFMLRKWNICLFLLFNQHIVAAHEYVTPHLSCFFLDLCQMLSTSKLCGTYSLPQNFHIRKLGEISLFYGAIAGYHVLCWFSACLGYKLFKPFHVFGLLSYLPEDIRKPMVLRCFQVLWKQISGKQWVIWKSAYSGWSCRTKDKVIKIHEKF